MLRMDHEAVTVVGASDRAGSSSTKSERVGLTQRTVSESLCGAHEPSQVQSCNALKHVENVSALPGALQAQATEGPGMVSLGPLAYIVRWIR